MRRIGDERCIGGSASRRDLRGVVGVVGCTVDGIGVWLQLCCIEDVGRHFWRTGSSLLEAQHGTREGYGERGSFAIGWIRLNWVFSLFVSAAQMLFFWLYAKVDQVRLQSAKWMIS